MSRARNEFNQFVDQTGASLLRTVYLIVRDLAAAEDIVQETLLRVARRWPRVRRMEEQTAYARRIAVNLALDEHRARAREGDALKRHQAEHNGSGRDESAQAEQHADLITALSCLAPRARAVIVLRYYGDLSESDVADTLGCSVGTVKTTAWRALETLRKQGADTYVIR